MNKYSLFNSFVSASILQWIDSHTKNDDGIVPPILKEVRTKCYYHKALYPFTDEEIDIFQAIDKEPRFQELKAVEISYLIMALAVLKLWIKDIPKDKRQVMNIADRRMSIGSAHYAMHMLKAKQLAPELYASEKSIIRNTNTHSVEWYEYFKNKLVKDQK